MHALWVCELCCYGTFLYQDISTVILSHPPIGTIGFTESAAREEFGDDQITVLLHDGL